MGCACYSRQRMRQSFKTIGVWLVLMVLFVAFYQVFSTKPDGAAPAIAEASQSAVRWSSWLPMVLVVAFFIYFMRLQRKYRPSHEGVRLLAEGRYAQALERFEQYRTKLPKEPTGLLNLGLTKLQLWKLEAALVDLEAARSLTQGKAKVGELATFAAEHLAITQALLGKEADARQSLQSIPAGQGHPGRVRLSEAILLARAGDAVGARAKLNTFEAKQLGGTLGALARTVDALCIERVSGERRHVDRIALFGETGPEELARAWPELVSFVERAPAW